MTISIAAFARRFASGLFAAHLCVGGMGLPGSALAGPGPATIAAASLPAHGTWHGFQTTRDGETVVGAVSATSKGGGVAFAIRKGRIGLWMWKQDLALPVGKTIPVAIEVGGDTFSGTAVVREANFVEIESVSQDVVEHFMKSNAATLAFAGIVWTLDLQGFTPSVKDALNV